MNEKKNTVKIWFVGNNDTENPDVEIDDCNVKLYASGTNVIKTTSTDQVDMFIPHHNINIIVQRKSIDEDST